MTPSLATPSGITLVKEKTGGRRNAQATFRFGDEHGMKVYARLDPSAACDQKCAKGWSPLLVSPGAAPSGDWTAIALSTGAKQWAYKGEALFTNAEDPPFEDKSEAAEDAKLAAKFDDVVASVKASVAPKDKGGASKARSEEDDSSSVVDPKVWKLVVLDSAPLTTPPGISVAQISNAFGEGLVDDKDMTIYVHRGKAPRGQNMWAPVRAPTRASRVGEFTVVSAEDGTGQWAFRGMPLYTYAKDTVPGHANGVNAGEGWHAAMTTQYFAPAGVRVTVTPLAEVLTVNGHALYTRNPFIYQLGGHNVREGLPGSYAVGKKLGTGGCDRECLKTWRPFIAPPDARPSGFWQIAVRPDGTRQWEYKGYVLYTYAGDLNPGEINGNDIYDLVDGEAPGRFSPVDAGGVGGAALFWHVATPY
jgi:predicted lipoprotein with Yx(FWY)xxD motif